MDDDQNEETYDIGEEQWSGVGGKSSLPPASQTVGKPPTRDELRNIREASDLFKSSSFKLQVIRDLESHESDC